MSWVRMRLVVIAAAGAFAVAEGCATDASTSATAADAGADSQPVDASPAPGFDAGADVGTDTDASVDASPPPDAAPPGFPGGPGRALVGGATVSTSQHYKAIRTLGQGPGGNGVMSSSKHRVQGGVVGATQ
jgi:hypothetical protein